MDWLSFLIGALVGWLVEWLIDYLFLRPRRLKAEAEIRLGLANAQQGFSASKGQPSEVGDRLVRLREADRLERELQARVARQADLEAWLSSARAEADSLRAQLAGAQDLQRSIDGAQREIDSLKAHVATMADLREQLDASRAESKEHVLEIERLRAKLAAVEGTGSRISERLNQDGIRTSGE